MMEEKFNQEGQSWVDYQCVRIVDLHKAGQNELALAITDESLEIWPNLPILLYLKSLILLDLHRAGEAITTLRKTQNVIPFDQHIADLLGRNLMFQGYYHTAAHTLRHFDQMPLNLAGYSAIALLFLESIYRRY